MEVRWAMVQVVRHNHKEQIWFQQQQTAEAIKNFSRLRRLMKKRSSQ